MTAITECPCCGWNEYVEPPKDEREAVLSCPWCIQNVNGKPRMCAMAEELSGPLMDPNEEMAQRRKL